LSPPFTFKRKYALPAFTPLTSALVAVFSIATSVSVNSVPSSLCCKTTAAAPAGAQGAVKVNAPMPGKILKVNATAGAAVKKGDVLVVLEAMKMENEICAPQDGTIATVECAAGDSVESGKVLVSLN
jgi:biotin carboxyl carrier protein